MGITFTFEDEFGNSNEDCYGKAICTGLDDLHNSGRIWVPVYASKAARDADEMSYKAKKEFSLRDETECEDPATPLSDLKAAIIADGYYPAVYAYIKSQDAELNAGTDDA